VKQVDSISPDFDMRWFCWNQPVLARRPYWKRKKTVQARRGNRGLVTQQDQSCWSLDGWIQVDVL